MVEISIYGSGEGLGWETGRGYSTTSYSVETRLKPSDIILSEYGDCLPRSRTSSTWCLRWPSTQAGCPAPSRADQSTRRAAVDRERCAAGGQLRRKPIVVVDPAQHRQSDELTL
jgi:hypothetical protein